MKLLKFNIMRFIERKLKQWWSTITKWNRKCSPFRTPEFTPVFSRVRVTRSLVLCVCFVERCFSFCPFYFGHCVVCPSIYRFWLPLWYLQTLLPTNINKTNNQLSPQIVKHKKKKQEIRRWKSRPCFWTGTKM